MKKKLFTDKQIKELKKNKYVKNISDNGITYTDEFKYKVIKEVEKNNKFATAIFKECGIDPEIIGSGRIRTAVSRWKKQFKEEGEFKQKNMGCPRKRELSEKEKLEQAEIKIKLLEAENELLKKNNLIEQGILPKIKYTKNMN